MYTVLIKRINPSTTAVLPTEGLKQANRAVIHMYSVLPTIISGFTYQRLSVFVHRGLGGIGNSDTQVHKCDEGFNGIRNQFSTFAITIATKIMLLVIDPEMNMAQIKWIFCYSYKNHLTT